MKTMAENKNKYIGESKLLGKPKNPLYPVTKTKFVYEGKETQEDINARVWKAIESLPNEVKSSIIELITNPLDQKYSNITKELYSMIASLQVGGIALSGKLGEREDIGIHQKALTKLFGRLFGDIGEITGKDYMNFTLTVVPTTTYSEDSVVVNIKADCREAISDFDSIKIYVDDEFIAESSDIEVFFTTATISKTSIVKAVGVIMGRTVVRTQQVIKEIPFFMGSGMDYQDAMTADNHKVMEGTLEGDYDVVIKHTGDYMFIIIPKSYKDEFRRADMNGYEILFEEPEEKSDYIIRKSKNTYMAGTYNIDIDINS
jgi:hypothetical protein